MSQRKISAGNAWRKQRATLPRQVGWVVGFAAAMCTSLGSLASAQEPTLSSAAPSQNTTDDEEVLSLCRNGLRLSGAFYNERRPSRSFAVLQRQDGGFGAVYRAGGWIGAYQLVAIEPRGVLLRDDTGECWLQLRSEPGNKTSNSEPPPRKHKARKAAKASSVTVIGGQSK